MNRVLITGVYGLIGNVVYRRLVEGRDGQGQPSHEVHGLSRRERSSARISEGNKLAVPASRFHLAHLEDYDAVRRAVAGMDAVIHMAADPSGARGWESSLNSSLNSNLIGAYDFLEAARDAGVRRVVFAS